MAILKIKDDNNNIFTIPAIKGDKGDKGEKGDKGADGYTPVVGVDYFTDTDKAEFEAYIASELAKRGQHAPEYANSIEECTDTTKMYVLPDGYIYAYMSTTTTGKVYTNILDGTTLNLNKRYSCSSSTYKDATGIVATDWLPVSTGDVVRINVPLSSFEVANTNIFYKYSNGTTELSGQLAKNSTPMSEESDGTVVSFIAGTVYNTMGDSSSGTKTLSNITQVLLNFSLSSSTVTETDVANLVITLNEEIKESEITSYQWVNTGLAFVPADYEDRILELENEVANLQNQISNIEENGTISEQTDTIPTYWADTVNATISKVKALQDAGGKDVVNFMWFSDVHYGGSKNYIGNIGLLCKTIMNECDIPLALMNGDTLTAGVLDSEEKLLEMLEGAWDIYSPIGIERRLMLVSGNHDDVYGSYTAEDETTAYYVNKATPQKVWNKLYRPQTQDFRRVFGGNSTYFYLDNVPQKVRYICLNSSFYDGEAITNGTTKAMSFDFGTEQLTWLENTALSVDSEWSVILCVHVPPISEYEGYFTGNNYTEIRRIITNSPADIIAVFTGHMHRDNVVTGDLPCPVVTVICATNTPYDGTAAERVLGTDKETAIDVVSINKATKTINCTRIGAGSDREISY